MIGRSRCIFAAVRSEAIGWDDRATLSAIGNPRTRDEIAGDGGSREELDGSVRLGNSADIVVLVPKNTVCIECHGEATTNGKEDFLDFQSPGLQVDGDGTAAQLASVQEDGERMGMSEMGDGRRGLPVDGENAKWLGGTDGS